MEEVSLGELPWLGQDLFLVTLIWMLKGGQLVLCLSFVSFAIKISVHLLSLQYWEIKFFPHIIHQHNVQLRVIIIMYWICRLIDFFTLNTISNLVIIDGIKHDNIGGKTRQIKHQGYSYCSNNKYLWLLQVLYNRPFCFI